MWLGIRTAILLLLAAAAWSAASTKADPYKLTDDPNKAGLSNTAGRTLAVPSRAGERVGVIVMIGQSQLANRHEGSYTPASNKNQNFNPYDGQIYESQSSILGPSGTASHVGPRAADKLIAARLFDRVVLLSVAVGGTSIAEWVSSGKFAHRTQVAALRLSEARLKPTVVLIHRGETDALNGMSRAAYHGYQSAEIYTIRSFWPAVPILVSRSTYVAGGLPAGSSAIRAAQASFVDNLTIFAGPDTDALTGDHRATDTTHLSAKGVDAFAGMITATIAGLVHQAR